MDLENEDKKWYERLPELQTKKSSNPQPVVTASLMKVFQWRSIGI